MLNPEDAAKLEAWRLKAANGTLSQEEMKEAIILLRQGRKSAAESAASTKKAAAKAAVKSGSDLLNELGGL